MSKGNSPGHPQTDKTLSLTQDARMPVTKDFWKSWNLGSMLGVNTETICSYLVYYNRGFEAATCLFDLVSQYTLRRK